jgi:hypothetical protein
VKKATEKIKGIPRVIAAAIGIFIVIVIAADATAAGIAVAIIAASLNCRRSC